MINNFVKMSKKVLLSGLVGLFLMSAIGTSFAQKKEKDKQLDKKTFILELKLKGGKKGAEPVADEINFSNNKFKSKYMNTEFAFNPADYSVEAVDSTNKDEKIVDFKCVQKNDKGEELTWEGTIYVTKEEITIEGFVILSNKGKKKKEWDYTGTLKLKKKK